MYSSKGFSLIELIITLAVIAIVSSIAMTFSGAFLQDNRISTANNDLVSSIHYARSTAVTRGTSTSICASSDGMTCTSTAWELGWIVFTDEGSAGVVDGTDRILKVSNQASIDISITSPSAYLQFKPQGAVASVCMNCLDKTITQRLDSIFVAAIKNLSPISIAHASGSSGSSGSFGSSGSSGSSGDSGSSGGSGHSGGSGELTVSCVAPDSEVTAGGSGGSGHSGGSGGSGGSSASLDVERYTD